MEGTVKEPGPRRARRSHLCITRMMANPSHSNRNDLTILSWTAGIAANGISCTSKSGRHGKPKMTKTKTTPVLLDRLAGELAKHGVTLKRTHLLQVAARTLGYDNTHVFTADDKAGELAPPAADYLGREEVSGYGTMEFFGDPEGGIFAVQKDRIDALSGRKDNWILSPMGGVLDISGLRGIQRTIRTTTEDSHTGFSAITDGDVRHIIVTAQCDEDSICQALTFTREHFDETFSGGSPIGSTMLGHIEEAEHQWNEEGDAAASMEALREYWSCIKDHVDAHDGAKVSCGNCDWTGTEDDCNEIEYFSERVTPGETMPAGECPECGALAHLVTDENEMSVDAAVIARRIIEIRADYDAANAKCHRPADTMEVALHNLNRAERAMLANDLVEAENHIARYEDNLKALRAAAELIDRESPIYLTNGCCEFPHEHGWMFEGTGLEAGSFDGDFYPLTDEEAAFIAEDLVTSADGRMHALTGYSSLYRGAKHIMPSIELPTGPEHDAPSHEEVRKTAEKYVAAILPKVEALGGNVLIDSGIDDCVVILILVPFSKVIELGNQWYPMLEWLMVDPRLPNVEEGREWRHEGRDFAVDVSWIGEGDDGDYDPMRPLDHPLLRFDVQRNVGTVDNEWEDQDDGSYCALVPAYASPDILETLPRYLAERLDTEGGAHPKRLMEQLSWTGIGNIERFLITERNTR